MYCIQCATPLTTSRRGGRERPTCPACGWVLFNPAPVGVAAVVLNAQGQVLLIRRHTSFRNGMWCLPCGYLEGDEELRTGLARELHEETGLHADVGEVLAVHSNTDRDPPYPVGIWMRARPTGGTLQANDDADLVQFFDLDNLPEPLAFETDRMVLDLLRTQHDHPDATIKTLTDDMHTFVRSKGWYEPHSTRPQTPRNLAISLNLEAAEVLEHVQWSDTVKDVPALAGELADVQLYLLQLADILGINLTQAVYQTLQRNQQRMWDEPTAKADEQPQGL